MKVLIVGSNQVWAIENHYMRYLNEQGVQVSIFACTEYYKTSSIVNRILLRLHNTSMFSGLNIALIESCKRMRPDIVWVFKGIEIFKSTLQAIRNLDIKLVNYNPDHPFIRTSISHGNKTIEESIPLYDMHFCYSRSLRTQLQQEYGLKANLLPFAYEPSSLHLADPDISADINRVAMVGHADRNRASIIKKMLDHGLSIDLFGPNWNRFYRPSESCKIHPGIFGHEFWRTLLDYRVQLNIFRPHNEGSHNMRTFEIPSIGGIQLAPWSQEHVDFFRAGKEIWLYSSTDELIQKAKELLQLSTAEALSHRVLAKARCITEDYTYSARAKHALICLEELLK